MSEGILMSPQGIYNRLTTTQKNHFNSLTINWTFFFDLILNLEPAYGPKHGINIRQDAHIDFSSSNLNGTKQLAP